MRPHINEFFMRCAATLPCQELIVEIGAFQVPGQEAIADLRPFFQGKKYLGCDMQHGAGVDQIENIHHLTFPSGSVGTFLLADTLEHVADPIRGMQEIHRCLRDDGIAIFTSVMHFPIHAYPNDYWRFTPESFRALAEPFPKKAIYYAGPEGFPHTVCGVAANGGVSSNAIRALESELISVKTPAPPHFQQDAERVIKALAAKLVESGPAAAKKPPKPALPSGFGRCARPGWYLVDMTWLEGWVFAPGLDQVEIVAQGEVLGRGRIDRTRPDIAEKHGFDPDALIGFSVPLRLPEQKTRIGALEMWAIGPAGNRTFVRESAPGVILGEIVVDPRIVLHSFDDAPGSQIEIGR